jgi:rhodanese-related sulfurtransferase
MTADELLQRARTGLERLDPRQAHEAVQRGAVIVDVRSEFQRARDGVIPGARFHPRNVLEWRLDPACDARDPEVARYDAHVIVMCDEGYQSSLAAANLRAIGLARATDLAGGFQAWRAAGLPVEPLQ